MRFHRVWKGASGRAGHVIQGVIAALIAVAFHLPCWDARAAALQYTFSGTTDATFNDSGIAAPASFSISYVLSLGPDGIPAPNLASNPFSISAGSMSIGAHQTQFAVGNVFLALNTGIGNAIYQEADADVSSVSFFHDQSSEPYEGKELVWFEITSAVAGGTLPDDDAADALLIDYERHYFQMRFSDGSMIGGLLSDVSMQVTAIPAPTALTLLVAALGPFAALRRRRSSVRRE